MFVEHLVRTWKIADRSVTGKTLTLGIAAGAPLARLPQPSPEIAHVR